MGSARTLFTVAAPPITSQATELRLHAKDGYPLAGRLWSLSEDRLVHKAVMINSGAGINCGFYNRFASFLADQGVPTLVYDYRGIGGSRPRSLRGFRASVEEWGSKDCAAALDWLSGRFPGATRVVVGHSVGGFVTGFITNGALVDRMLLISAHTGYWRDYGRKARVPMYLLWHALMPFVTRVVGYFPGRRLRLLEDLPAGVALEWAQRRKPDFWSHLKLADGSPDTVSIQRYTRRFDAIRARTLAIRFSDDPFATKEATERILGLYKNVTATRLVLATTDGDGRPIGHFGFFSSRFRDTLWPLVFRELFSETLVNEVSPTPQSASSV